LTDYLVRPDPSAAVFEAKSVRAKAEVDSCDHWNVEEEVSEALDICCCCPTAVKVKKYSLTPLEILYLGTATLLASRVPLEQGWAKYGPRA